jgi:hypothetical protein
MRRLLKLAEVALNEYGMSGAISTFQHYGGNVIFQVDLPAAVSSRDVDEF